MIKKIVYVVAIVGIAIGVVNDLGRYVTTRYTLSEVTSEAARVAAENHAGRDAAALEAAKYVQTRGAEVYAFDQTDVTVEVYTQMPLEGTWALAAVLKTVEDGSLTDPYMLRSEDSAPRQ